jgi:hypothetical protein
MAWPNKGFHIQNKEQPQYCWGCSKISKMAIGAIRAKLFFKLFS